MNSTLYIVIPCYKEQEVLHETASRLKVKMESLIAAGKISSESRVMFVNDGSSDNTWPIICELHESDPLFSGINLSRNRGHQNALLAGLMTAKDLADMVISMDADLQDDMMRLTRWWTSTTKVAILSTVSVPPARKIRSSSVLPQKVSIV